MKQQNGNLSEYKGGKFYITVVILIATLPSYVRSKVIYDIYYNKGFIGPLFIFHQGLFSIVVL